MISDIIQKIKQAKKFLITSHLNPEGDALGSELALARLLKALKKDVVIVNEDPVSQEYKFLPGASKILTARKIYNFDIAIIVDCSDIGRIGKIKDVIGNKFIINIDHHPANTNFGDINWVGDNYAATCEMVYELFDYFSVKIDRATALNLYAGIMTDTGSFRYSNTTNRTHKIVAHLLEWRLPVNRIYQIIYESIPYSDAKLLFSILPQIKRTTDGKIVWTLIKRDILQRKKTGFDLTETVLSFMRSIKGVEAVIVIREKTAPDLIRINFRSRGNIDVNKIALSFGGGGHKAASGATISGTIEDVERKVLDRVIKSYKKNK